MGVRNYPDTPRVYFDFDGTMADFLGAAAAHGMSPSEFKRMPGAYLNLPLIPGALDAIARVEALGLIPWGLTKIPAANPYAATEKLLWQQEHIQSLNDKVIIAADKGAVGRPCDFLIDDMPGWANARNFPGTLVPFEGDWDRVFHVIMKTLGRMA